jgi:hypothetical protein
MTDPRFFPLSGYEQTALPFLGRAYKNVPGAGKSIVTQADVAAISLKVQRFNRVNGAWGGLTTTVNGLAIPVATSVFNALQTDSSWNIDAIGYNFAHTIPATAFPGLGDYVAVYSFTPAGTNFSIFPLILKPITILSMQGTLVEG